MDKVQNYETNSEVVGFIDRLLQKTQTFKSNVFQENIKKSGCVKTNAYRNHTFTISVLVLEKTSRTNETCYNMDCISSKIADL